ncbi:hypothetical protein E0H89_11450 [Acinetobacter sp. ANC 3781]|uniref:hypothetical protein n=1 Tax=Acinetobacter sp. ANC 3781 TaxID=2529835 RepID=UPI00103E7A66|nr:hypothetical protein [Acinetobacter sp. ANC 3781]TCB75550.1 hypothetical protein E0H89_11450 [Acinetobacter sp. ANC 3781]
METALKIIGVLIVPILIVILNNRLAKLKHDREIKAEFLKLAEDLESDELEKRSTLYKDRLAKSAFNDDAITYSEVKFFLNYENADLWVRDYVKIRGMLERERDDAGEVTGFKRKSHWIKFVFALVLYGVCAFTGLIPFVIMNKYIAWMVSSYEKGMPLMIVLLVAIPIILLVVAYLCLRYTEKYASCGIFLHDFYKVAFKAKGAEEKNDSEVDVAA